MEYNQYFEQILANPRQLRDNILSMDSTTLGDFYCYVIGRIEYVDAESSFSYWYAASIMDETVEFVYSPEAALKKR